MGRLERFRTAQDSPDAGYASALAEIRSGDKRSHWIWYVFPQIAGLGDSSASRAYAIADEDEAVEFLHDPELRSRLLTIATAVAEQLAAGRPASLSALMGSSIDARKIVSSLTLFGDVARTLHAEEGLDAYQAIAQVADRVLAVAVAQGYPACVHTRGRLRERGDVPKP